MAEGAVVVRWSATLSPARLLRIIVDVAEAIEVRNVPLHRYCSPHGAGEVCAPTAQVHCVKPHRERTQLCAAHIAEMLCALPGYYLELIMN